jgi:hypothetical protein
MLLIWWRLVLQELDVSIKNEKLSECAKEIVMAVRYLPSTFAHAPPTRQTY